MSHQRKKVSGIVLGHQPLLSIAEVLSKTTNTSEILVANKDSLVISTESDIARFADDLGGIQKVATDMVECEKDDVLARASHFLLSVAQNQRQRKVLFTVSCYGSAEGMQRQLLKNLKRVLEGQGKSGRHLHKDMGTNAPNVLISNQIMGKGMDIVVIGHGQDMYVGVTTWVQNVDMYARRDMMKPRRDMKTGMLPPKLAQTLINLTTPRAKKATPCIWDPFCGLGVIPMEAVLMGLPVVGTDINPKMEENTRINMEWLTDQGANVPSWDVFTLNAREWPSVPLAGEIHPDCIVTEGTLGLNFLKPATLEQAESEQAELLTLYEDFFQLLSHETASGIQAITMTIPFHITEDGAFQRLVPKLLPTLYAYGFDIVNLFGDNETLLKKEGLTRSLTAEKTILYTRSKQFVGREILVLERL